MIAATRLLRPFLFVLLIACCGAPRPCEAQTDSASGQATETKTQTPQTYRSANFIVHTDLPKEEADDLLKRLETMLDLISKYWGQRNRKTIECVVVQDLKNWNRDDFEPNGLVSILNEAGVTLSTVRTQGNRFEANAKVYAIADRGTPQHEAVHAYCVQTFGTSGPVWYSEGMAEMGQYWKPNDASVNAHPIVIEYIQQSEPKSLNEIVNGNETTGDSWQNYAWRWALCHLLANNTNYQARFRPLGLALLTQQPDVSFESVYGTMADEISFEYLFFLNHIEAGYRVDLCSWDWKTKTRKYRGKSTLSTTIDAQAGWQATHAKMTAGDVYEYAVKGTWKLSKEGDALTAEGNDSGGGRLMGVIYSNYELSEPIDLGAYGEFKAEKDGQLFVRCQNDWGKIADHSGKVTFEIREKFDGTPLPDPRAGSADKSK